MAEDEGEALFVEELDGLSVCVGDAVFEGDVVNVSEPVEDAEPDGELEGDGLEVVDKVEVREVVIERGHITDARPGRWVHGPSH